MFARWLTSCRAKIGMKQQQMWRHAAVWVLQATAGLWLVAGCATVTENPAPNSLAWIKIEGRTKDQVHTAICDFFKERRFRKMSDTYPPQSYVYEMRFERLATTMNRWAYGALLEPEVQERIKLVISRAGDNWLITLDAFMVSNTNNAFEEEHKLSGLTRGTYQQVLDALKARLQ